MILLVGGKSLSMIPSFTLFAVERHPNLYLPSKSTTATVQQQTVFRQFLTSAALPHLLHACNDARTFGNLSKRRCNKMKTMRHEQRLQDNPT